MAKTDKELEKEKAMVLKDRATTKVEDSVALVERMGFKKEQFLRIVFNAFNQRKDLIHCDLTSVDLALLKCIEAGLVPDGEDAVIIPFKGKAKLIPMIQGRTRLAKQATPGLSLRSKVVYRDDEWEYEEGLKPILKHVPNAEGSRSESDIIAAYAIAVTPGSDAPEFVVLQKSDIDRAKALSPAGNSGPWGNFFSEMAEKTARGRVLKGLPKRPGQPMFDDEEDADIPEIYDAAEMPATGVEIIDEGEEQAQEEKKPERKPRRARKPKETKPEPEPDPPEVEDVVDEGEGEEDDNFDLF